jgi:cell division protein FtsB
LASGQTIAPLKFRRGDFWHEVAQQVNALRDRQEQLEQQNNRLTAENRQLKRQLAELPELSGNP